MSNDPLSQEIGSGDRPRCQEAMGVPLLRLGTKGKNSRDEALQDWYLQEKSTGGPSNGSAAGPSISTIGDIFEDEITTITDTLVAIKSARPRTTSVVIRNVKEEPRRATPVPIVQSQDKEQEAKDDALIEQIEDVQARMDVDELLAARLQEQEREQFSVDEHARFLVETIATRKKFFATQRATKI
ncbi:hypothetical protein Tco_1285991 [Tanacetum coccineum]